MSFFHLISILIKVLWNYHWKYPWKHNLQNIMAVTLTSHQKEPQNQIKQSLFTPDHSPHSIKIHFSYSSLVMQAWFGSKIYYKNH